ncbi:MAG: hypothetical protein AAFV53_25090 [Myxococcota bacterium]
MDPRNALQDFHRGDLNSAHLLRALVTHGHWRMLSQEEDGRHRPLLRMVDDERWLQLFTDDAAMREHLATVGPDAQAPGWVETTGEWIFGNLGEDLAGVDINPQLPEAVHYGRDQLEMLRAWSRALAVERALRDQTGDADTVTLLSEARYQLAFIEDAPGQAQLALAPDPQGRQLVAVFTAPDAAVTFVEAAGRALGKAIKLQEVPGHRLFPQLGRMSIDGIVFNCLGPVDPVAVGLSFTQAFPSQEPS